MSSMHRATALLLLLFLAMMSAPARCQDGSEWDKARLQLVNSQHGTMSQAIERWRMMRLLIAGSAALMRTTAYGAGACRVVLELSGASDSGVGFPPAR